MKNPAESMAGTTATFSVVFSGAPKLVGSALAIEAVVVPVAPPLAEEEEQPAASPATAVSAAAHAAVRHQIRLPGTGTPH
jgi:hypothetical protein